MLRRGLPAGPAHTRAHATDGLEGPQHVERKCRGIALEAPPETRAHQCRRRQQASRCPGCRDRYSRALDWLSTFAHRHPNVGGQIAASEIADEAVVGRSDRVTLNSTPDSLGARTPMARGSAALRANGVDDRSRRSAGQRCRRPGSGARRRPTPLL